MERVHGNSRLGFRIQGIDMKMETATSGGYVGTTTRIHWAGTGKRDGSLVSVGAHGDCNVGIYLHN